MSEPYPAAMEWLVQQRWVVEHRGDTDWLIASTHYSSHDKAIACQARRQQQFPDREHRIVRVTTTYAIEPTP